MCSDAADSSVGVARRTAVTGAGDPTLLSPSPNRKVSACDVRKQKYGSRVNDSSR